MRKPRKKGTKHDEEVKLRSLNIQHIQKTNCVSPSYPSTAQRSDSLLHQTDQPSHQLHE